MRLAKIKLAGFKSFVESTTIHFISNLSAVVGPNGCGKSNVIDAIRWVMGESSAKHLRGGQLTDVIFSGSTNRKPLGQAFVELYFDNSDGCIGGAYAAYAEITIRRQVSRDGQSYYAINNTKCRRRDVMDMFMGTGLGPRSYAIIEQGMITRIIESKPEDLRVFIEEAAGISKYKERRKETEEHIKQTEENLQRLGDLHQELEKQINHLKKQAVVAQKFKELRVEEKTMSGQLAALSWQRLDSEIVEWQTQITILEQTFETQNTDHQCIEDSLTAIRAQVQIKNEAFRVVQNQCHALATELARVEQNSLHLDQKLEQLAIEKMTTQREADQAKNDLETDQHCIDILQAEIERLSPLYQAAEKELPVLYEKQEEQEKKLKTWQCRSDKIRHDNEQALRNLDREKNICTTGEQQCDQLMVRFNRLASETVQIEESIQLIDLSDLSDTITTIEETLLIIDEKITINKTLKQETHRASEILKTDLHQIYTDIQKEKGRQASLEALQEVALGKNNVEMNASCASYPRLAECIEVCARWSPAVEHILGEILQALCVQDIDQLTRLTQSVDPLMKGSLSICTVGVYASQASTIALPRLLDQIQWRSNTPMPALLIQIVDSIYLAESIDAALGWQSQLGMMDSIITPEGFWVGAAWLRKGGVNDYSGVLEREQALQALKDALVIKNDQADQMNALLAEYADKLSELESAQEDLIRSRQAAHHHLMDVMNNKQKQQTTRDHQINRLGHIQKESMEIDQQKQVIQDQMSHAMRCIEDLTEQLGIYDEEKSDLEAQQVLLQQDLLAYKAAYMVSKEKGHELALGLQKNRSELTLRTATLEKAQKYLLNLSDKDQDRERFHIENQAVIAELVLQQKDLESKKQIVEAQLSEVQQELSQLENEALVLEKQRAQAEKAINQVRTTLEKANREAHALVIHRDHVLEKFMMDNEAIQAVLVTLTDDLKEKELESKLAQIKSKLQKLGPINLAAIGEYEVEFERKQYLDKQVSDLNDALLILEDSIKKMDQETRNLFKETFHAVNDNFKKIFPKLFGGGDANLGLIGDDYLSSGISVVGRPPGKRNSTIHQLSGGEKALTAVSLIFAIFQLNPAPFCLLDEVDAPLDDNNVGRFCNLVKEMSETVQFIYISHNKLALEMAGELQGVTMREPGVSRLVTVDLEEAIRRIT